MKRKSIVRILTIALFAVVSALSFAACAKQTAKHTHKYDQRKIRHDSAQIFGQLQVALRTKLAYDHRHEGD